MEYSCPPTRVVFADTGTTGASTPIAGITMRAGIAWGTVWVAVGIGTRDGISTAEENMAGLVMVVATPGEVGVVTTVGGTGSGVAVKVASREPM